MIALKNLKEAIRNDFNKLYLIILLITLKDNFSILEKSLLSIKYYDSQ